MPDAGAVKAGETGMKGPADHIPPLPEGHHPLSPVALWHTVKHSALHRLGPRLLTLYVVLAALGLVIVLLALAWYRWGP